MQLMSEIRTSMDFRHSIAVRFPNTSNFRQFLNAKDNFLKIHLKTEAKNWFSDTQGCLKSKLAKVWISDKFRFQTFTVMSEIQMFGLNNRTKKCSVFECSV